MKTPIKSRGVALVTALLVVSLATVAAVSFATQQQLDLRRTGNLIDGDQAWAYAKGAEAWAKLILRRDLANSAETDNLTEIWAQTLPPIDLPGGYMIGSISDAQARLNLNNLATGDEASIRRLQRLLVLLELDPNITSAIVDWLDPDINARPPDGAEDDYYMGLDFPYRTANRPMASVSELRLIKGIDEESYRRLAPFVTALPAQTAININTAPPMVLATLADGMDPEMALALVEIRQETPFRSVGEISAHPLLAGIGLQLDATNLTVASEFFEANIETRIGYGRANLSSLIVRADQNNIAVIRRSQGQNYGYAINPDRAATDRDD